MSVFYAETSIDGVLPSFDKTYAYLLNENEKNVKKGTRVLVPFGASNKPRLAIVTAVSDVRPQTKGKIKSVIRAVDSSPVLTEEMIELAFWLKERTLCTVYEAVKAMLPTGINYKTTVSYSLNDAISYDDSLFDDEEKKIVGYLLLKKSGFYEKEKICKEAGVSVNSSAFEKLHSVNILLRNFVIFLKEKMKILWQKKTKKSTT